MNSMENSDMRGPEAVSRWFPSMEAAPGHALPLYMGILSGFIIMAWLSSRPAVATEAPDYYEHAMAAYAALIMAAYMGFTLRAGDEKEGGLTGRKRDTAQRGANIKGSLIESALNAAYLALLTLPFLAASSILTLMGVREVALILSLVVVCFMTYRYISIHLARALKGYPLLLYVLQLTLFIVVLFLSLISYPALSPLFALHSVTALSRLTLGAAGFYRPLGIYLITISLHGLALGALVVLDILVVMRRYPANEAR